MRIATLALLGALIVLGSHSGASAQSIYYGLHGGLNLSHDSDGTSGGVTTESVYDPGFAVGGFAGYDLGSGLRIEGELTYRVNDVDTVGGINLDGDFSSLAFMANGFYDFEVGGSPFVPYFGGGIGAAIVSANDIGSSGLTIVDDDDTVFAYQLSVGVGYELSPTVTLTADYRYFATADAEIVNTFGVPADVEYSNSTFLIGARATF